MDGAAELERGPVVGAHGGAGGPADAQASREAERERGGDGYVGVSDEATVDVELGDAGDAAPGGQVGGAGRFVLHAQLVVAWWASRSRTVRCAGRSNFASASS